MQVNEIIRRQIKGTNRKVKWCDDFCIKYRKSSKKPIQVLIHSFNIEASMLNLYFQIVRYNIRTKTTNKNFVFCLLSFETFVKQNEILNSYSDRVRMVYEDLR